MARQPAWFERLDAALAELRTLEVPHIDRLTVERLFGLSRRDAIRLLHRFGATDQGNDRLELVRQGLIAQLEALQAGAEYRNWLAHQQHRQAELAAAAAVQNARRIPIPVAEDADRPSLARLPTSIRLIAGRLEVSFGSEEDLWSQLEQLARTAVADRAAFRARIEPPEE